MTHCHYDGSKIRVTNSQHEHLPTIAATHDSPFDNVQLLDVSGLMSDLSWYWRMGGVVVGTPNKVSDDPCKNRVRRRQLEPCVEEGALSFREPLRFAGLAAG